MPPSKLKITRTTSSHGFVLAIHFPQLAYIAQVYAEPLGANRRMSWYAWVMEIFNPDETPTVTRVPEWGGVETPEELEELLINRR